MRRDPNGHDGAQITAGPTADVEALQSAHPDYLFTSIPPFFAFLKTRYGD